MEVRIPFCVIFFAILIGLFMVIDTKHHHSKHHSRHNDLEDSDEEYYTSHNHHSAEDWDDSEEEHHQQRHHGRRGGHGHDIDFHGRGFKNDIQGEGRAAKGKKPPPKAQDLDTFRQEGLKFHNKFRANHGTPPLEIDDELNELALTWAQEISDGSDAVKRIVLSHTPDMTHDGGTGDNIFACKCFDVTGERAANQWYSEEKKYNYNDPKYHWTWGHYTQLMWKSTTKLGMAKVKSPIMGFVIVVATYLPRGNMNYTKSFKDNVLPPTGGKPTKSAGVEALPAIIENKDTVAAPADGENAVEPAPSK